MKKMIEGEDFCAEEMVFPFQTAFLDRSMGCSDKPLSTLIPTLNSDIVNFLLFGTWELNAPDQHVLSLPEMFGV